MIGARNSVSRCLYTNFDISYAECLSRMPYQVILLFHVIELHGDMQVSLVVFSCLLRASYGDPNVLVQKHSLIGCTTVCRFYPFH
jgi:hypothetical protein